RLVGRWGEEDARRFAGWAGLRTLSFLGLVGWSFAHDGMLAALLASPHLGHLTTLQARCRLDWEGAEALARCPSLPNLRMLGLNENDLGADGAEILSQSHYLGRLTALHLGSNRLGVAGVTALARSEGLTNLRSLDLGYDQMKDEGAATLATSPIL